MAEIISIKDKIRSQAQKIIDKAVKGSSKEPSLHIMEQFTNNGWKAYYLLVFYISRFLGRVISIHVLLQLLEAF